LRHCPHTSPYSDEKGKAHILHDGPEYLCILDQQDAQIGEWWKISEILSQEGHFEG